jgi:hypothetical protein
MAKKKKMVGLACVNKETRTAIAKLGGNSPHRIRGLAAASQATRKRVATKGGKA